MFCQGSTHAQRNPSRFCCRARSARLMCARRRCVRPCMCACIECVPVCAYSSVCMRGCACVCLWRYGSIGSFAHTSRQAGLQAFLRAARRVGCASHRITFLSAVPQQAECRNSNICCALWHTTLQTMVHCKSPINCGRVCLYVPSSVARPSCAEYRQWGLVSWIRADPSAVNMQWHLV